MEPDDGGTDLPVIEMALAEELGGQSPPDLWPRLQTRMRSEARPRRWLVAALVLLGTAIVAGVALLDGAEPRSAGSPPDQRILETDASGPESLRALQAMLDTVRSAETRSHVTWSEEHGDWFSLSRHPFEAWFGNPRTRRSLNDSLLDVLVTALPRATEVSGAPRRHVWQHSVTLTFAKGQCRCLLADEGNAFVLGIASPRGPIPLHAVLPDATLRPLLEQSTRLTLDDRGIAIGARGLDALSSECTKLRVYRVPASAAAQLPRFTKVNAVELCASPEWHSAAVLGQVAQMPLRYLAVQGRLLDKEAIAVITAMTGLEELSVVGEDLWQSFLDWPQLRTAPALDDVAVQGIAGMRNLERVMLCGSACTDIGLAALAQLPRLRHLYLSGCHQVTGSGLQAFAQHGLEGLDLRGCGLAVEFLGALANLPKLRTVCLGSHIAILDLRACPDLPHLEELWVDGRMAIDQLATLSRFRGLKKLHLILEPELRDEDLAMLHGLTQLGQLYLVSSRITEAGRERLHAALPQCSISREMW